MASLLERYHNNIRGVLSCFDRVIIQGTLPGLCYARMVNKLIQPCGFGKA